MPDYSQGKIYKIVSPNHEKIYIGSTCLTLERRFSLHKSKHQCCSTEIIDAGDARIELIELFPCLDRAQLEDREGEVQLMDWDGCVNDRVAGAYRRAGGKKAYDKVKNKEYREENAEKIKAQKKAHYEANSEAIKAQNKAYREANSETIKAKKRQKITCFCGATHSRQGKAKHQRTKRHMNFVEIISMI